ncbi:MAG: hypothetical protein KA109_08005 [Saprospiraceae bacterium]|nr:hypothetical protein [Saprospiraceae bacterium]MBP8094543.1 hypothetical protein [Saprospiraceae bacterium]
MRSRWVIIIGMVAMIYAAFVYYPKWKLPRTEATISWDVSGYYLYLPAFFIYHDLKNLDFKPGLDEQYYPSSSPYQSYTHTSGHQVMKYTCGLAILYSPFFLLAHILALLFGWPADGYSSIYQFFISLGGLVYALIGLVFFRRLLLRYFDDLVTAVVLAILVFATNYFDYASITGAMSHNYLFTLYASILICIDQFYKSGSKKWFFITCFIMGLMVLIRPTEVLSKILLVAWGVSSWSGLKERVQFYFSRIPMVVYGVILWAICPLIQGIYWKYVTGEWLVYSYQEQGFSWLEGHHILQGVLSYRAGWLVYTPIMILSLLGLIYLWIRAAGMRWVLTAFILGSLYLTFAWDEWTYGGSLGQRALIQHYPLYLLAAAPLIRDLLARNLSKYVLYSMIALSSYYNLWLTHQAHKGGIYEAGMMNKAYFWHTLFKPSNDLESKKLLDTNEPVVSWDEAAAQMIKDTVYQTDTACAQASQAINLYDGLVPAGKLKVNTLVQIDLKEWDVWQMAQLILQYSTQDKVEKTVMIRLHRFINNHEEKWIDLVTTSPLKYDHIKISVWNPSSQRICIKALRLYGQK